MSFLQARKNLHIRRMMLEDLDRVVEIEPLAFGSHHWTRHDFAQELNNDFASYLIAELVPQENDGQGDLIAYGGAWEVVDEMHITTLATDPNHRRKYGAESIITAFIDQALKNKIRGITLEVRVSNEAAQKLYGKYGFQSMGRRKRYYQDNHEDALLLWTEDLQTDSFKTLFSKNIDNLSKK